MDESDDVPPYTRERSPHARTTSKELGAEGAQENKVVDAPYRFDMDDESWLPFLMDNGYVVVKEVASPGVSLLLR